MSKLYRLDPVSSAFIDNAPYRIKRSIEMHCSVSRMMEALSDNDQWAQWARPIKKAAWTSPRREKNCTRDVYLIGGILLQEVFFEWDNGVRASFFVEKANIPGLKSFAEDHRIIPLGDNKLRLDFIVAFDMTRSARWLAPVIHLALKAMVPGMLRNYRNLLESH
jgi:hypothetical protein